MHSFCLLFLFVFYFYFFVLFCFVDLIYFPFALLLSCLCLFPLFWFSLCCVVLVFFVLARTIKLLLQSIWKQQINILNIIGIFFNINIFDISFYQGLKLVLKTRNVSILLSCHVDFDGFRCSVQFLSSSFSTSEWKVFIASHGHSLAKSYQIPKISAIKKLLIQKSPQWKTSTYLVFSSNLKYL